MKKGTPLTLTIDKLLYPAKGIAYYEDHAFQVDGTYPGEVVTGEFGGWKQKRGRLWKPNVIKFRDDFEAPRCRHYGKCGGCISQHLPLFAQRELKKQVVLDMLRQQSIVFPEPVHILGLDEKYHYRNKMEFNFGDAVKDGPLTLGMHERGHGFNIIDTDDCQLINQDMNTIRTFCADYFREKNIPFYQWLKREGILRHLIIRDSFFGHEQMVVLVTTSEFSLDLTEWVQGLLDLPLSDPIASIYHVVNDTIGNVVQADEMHLLYGKETITEQLLGLEFDISPLSFFQTNSAATELLYERVLKRIDKVDTALDLYCGTGTITQLIAKKAKRVIGVELIDEAVQSARQSAKRNQLTNVQFYSGDVKDVLEKLPTEVDLVVVDPPRAGLHPKVIEQLNQIAPERLIYVSCNPKSLVLDLLKLTDYQIDSLELIDLFPNTPHVETVILMSRVKE